MVDFTHPSICVLLHWDDHYLELKVCEGQTMKMSPHLKVQKSMWRPCCCIACTERTSFLCNIFFLNQNVMWINIDWLSSDERRTEREIQMDYMATCSPDARCHESSRPFHLPSLHLPWNPEMASGMVCCSHINTDSVLSAKVCCLSLCVFVCTVHRSHRGR